MSNLPTVTVYVNGQPVTELIRGWDICMALGSHTVVKLDVLYTGPFSMSNVVPTFAELSPVLAVYGTAPDVEVFYGYISHHQTIKDVGRTSKVLVRYFLLGTTQPMNNQHTRSWSSVSGSFIARQIAAANGLRAIVSPTDRVLDYWAQSGESDLRLMNDLASEHGFRFWADGSTLYFLDPNLLLTGPVASNIPVFNYDRQPGFPDTVIDIELVNGQNVPGNGILANRLVYGFDDRTSQSFKYTTAVNSGVHTGDTTPYLQQVATHRHVRNYGQAKAILDAATLNNRDWIQAEATVIGTPRLHPGSLVSLTGAALPGNSAGTWYVLEARHLLIPGRTGSGLDHKFATYLTLSRNTDTGVTFTRTHDLTAQQETVPCHLVGTTTWQSNIVGDSLV